MSRSTINKSLVIAAAAILAGGALADDAPGFYAGAGAGFMQAPALDAPAPPAPDLTSAFGGYRFNSRFGVEGFYADIEPDLASHSTGGNIYTRSLLGQGDDTDATVAGVSAIATLRDAGHFRPFARVGMHHFSVADFSDPTIAQAQGNSLLIGAGADVDLSRRWQARFEWERYTGVQSLSPDVFSARFEYKF